MSGKQRLILAMEKRVDELNEEIQKLSSEVWTYEMDIVFLRNRGSGPLPWWIKDSAKELGVEL